VPEAAPFLLEGWRVPSPGFLAWTLVQAVGSLVAVGLLYRGYQSGETSALAVFEYVFLLTAGATAWILWGERIDALSGLGMAMIAGGGRDHRMARSPGRGRDHARSCPGLRRGGLAPLPVS
jgi:drug/metabolite transporter (DMT)-like permease